MEVPASPVVACRTRDRAIMGMTAYTYIPATGRIFLNEKAYTAREQDSAPVGLASPMIAGATGGGIRASDVLWSSSGSWIPVMKTLQKHDAPQIRHDTNKDIDSCHKIMLLPALLEHATYPGIHAVFSEVPLARIKSGHPLPDDCGQVGPLDAEYEDPGARYARHAGFEAKKYSTSIRGTASDLYCTVTSLDMARLRGILEEREIKHEQEAFRALEEIEHTEYLNDIDVGRPDRTAAAKMSEIIGGIRSTYGSRITHVVMGSRTYRRYLEKSGISGAAVPRSHAGTPGTGPLPGLEYVTAVICPLADWGTRDVIYAVDGHSGALYGQGALVLEEYSDGVRDRTRITEYYEYMTTDGEINITYEKAPKRRTAVKMVIPDR